MSNSIHIRLACALMGLVAMCATAHADTVVLWDMAVAGQDPAKPVQGSAKFQIVNSTLYLWLANTTTATYDQQGLHLNGLTFDLDGFTGTLTAESASVGGSSVVVNQDGSTVAGTDVSDYWAFDANIAGPTSGQYGVGASGGISDSSSAFGNDEIISYLKTGIQVQYHPNGTDYSIIGPKTDLTKLNSNLEPWVRNEVKFTFTISGDVLAEGDIANVAPLFNTDGARLVPLPPAAWMGMSLLTGLGWMRARRGTLRR